MERLRKLGSAMQTDFCPWANKWVYWMKNPFWVIIAAAVAAGICAYCLQAWLWVLTGALLLIAIGGWLFPVVAIRGISLRVFFDIRRSQVSEPVLVRLAVRNRWWFPVWGLSVIRGLSINDSADASEGVSLTRVPARSEVEYTWEFVPGRRGVYPLEQMEVETGFPFGLIRASRPVSVHGSLIVWPRTVMLKGLPDAAESHAEDELSPSRAGHFGDIIGTREFREGDSLRRVHWAQSARRQTLIVNERQAPQTSTVRIVVDLRPEAHTSVDPETTECMISTAASICRSLHEQHCRVECQLAGKLFVAGEATYGYHALMDEFASCEVGDEVHQRQRSQSFEIVVTTDAGATSFSSHRCVVVGNTSDSMAADAWIRVLGWDGMADHLPQAWKGSCRVA